MLNQLTILGCSEGNTLSDLKNINFVKCFENDQIWFLVVQTTEQLIMKGLGKWGFETHRIIMYTMSL